MSSNLNARIDIKKTFSTLKAIEGGDIPLLLQQVRTLDTKTQLQWVSSALQKEVYNLRGDIMRRQEAEDLRLDEEKRVAGVIEFRKGEYRHKSWFLLFFEWLTSIPIGKRDEYEPENFDSSPDELQSEEVESETERESVDELAPESIPGVLDATDNIERHSESDEQDGQIDQQEIDKLTMEGPDGMPISSRQNDR